MVRVAPAIRVNGRAPPGRFPQMTGDKLRRRIPEKRRGFGEKAAGYILGSRHHFSEGRIVFVKEFVIEAVVDHTPDPTLDFADVNQHPGLRPDRAGENKIGDIIAAGAVARRTLRAKALQVFLGAQFRIEEPPRSGEFESLADGQKRRGQRAALSNSCGRIWRIRDVHIVATRWDAAARRPYPLRSARNSERVRASSLKEPSRHEVVMTEFCFSTPRIIMQRCFASITTATPAGWSACIRASAI